LRLRHLLVLLPLSVLVTLAWPMLGAPTVPVVSAQSSAQSGAAIAGSVVDGGLNPLAGVAVTLEREGRVQARTTTDGTGTFRFAGLATGSYRVRAELAGFTSLSKEFRVATGMKSLVLPLVMARPGDTVGPTFRSGEPMPPAAAPVPPPPGSNAEPMRETVAGNAGAAAGRGGAGGGGRGGGSGAAPAIGMAQRSGVAEQERYWPGYRPESGETYASIDANRFQSTRERPLSTFGADVDTASYSNVRRFLSSGQLPPRDAVRLEELVNYFRFAYANPRDGRPIALTTEIGDCPWAPTHKLVLIGARAKVPVEREITGRNLTLLIDVSGSMAPQERLPLIKTALAMFADTLRSGDTLSIVTYAGTSGVALYPTPARRRDVIQRAIASLTAGGSTNGAQGLVTAYRVAREAFVPGGINRVILATDGDFNVGITSEGDLLRLIERERESGVFLSVFGVGSGNLKDRTMEMLADKGNGNYSYLDSLQEARRVLIREGDATLETVAKDVKFQVEFNPAVISAWKLLGYENRALRAQDFNDDRKDAGEMGAGHTVTVLYEVVPVGVRESTNDASDGRPAVDPLRYQAPGQTPVARPQPVPTEAMRSGEWLQVKTRYKLPEGETSELITSIVRPGMRVQHLPLASAVAEFALLLRDAPQNAVRWDALARRVQLIDMPASMGSDREGFKELVELARGLARRY
jgi:Ca-activated chloride channel family protein